MPNETRVTLIDRLLAATVLQLLPARVTPNQITIFRFFTVPFVAAFIYLDLYAIAIPLFAISAFTDAMDGALARTKGQITEWGRIYDPIADKLLVGMVGLIIIPQFVGFALAFVIIFMEMLFIGTAYYLKNKGLYISANGWGKIKMVLQSLGVGFILIYALVPAPAILITAQYLLYASILFAFISFVTYGI